MPDSKLVIRSTWLSRRPRPGSVELASAMTILLVLSSVAYWMNFHEAARWMPASGQAVFEDREYWRLWSTQFAHADVGHLVANSFLFFVLGYFLFGYFGAGVFPFAAFLWGGFANLVVLPSYDPSVHLIGASGVVYWMGGAWLALYFFIARQRSRVPRWLRTIGVALLLFAPQSFEPNVSYRTHLAGFILGLVGGGLHFARHRRRYRAAEVVEPEERPEDLDPGDDLPPPEGLPINPPKS